LPQYPVSASVDRRWSAAGRVIALVGRSRTGSAATEAVFQAADIQGPSPPAEAQALPRRRPGRWRVLASHRPSSRPGSWPRQNQGAAADPQERALEWRAWPHDQPPNPQREQQLDRAGAYRPKRGKDPRKRPTSGPVATALGDCRGPGHRDVAHRSRRLIPLG